MRFQKLSDNSGITLLELMVTVTVLIILTFVFFVYVNPVEKKAQGRDGKRLADMALLDRVISEYFIDHESYPDVSETLRVSTSLPSGSISLDNIQGGWILENMSTYNARLPLDPLNNETYFYSYYHDAFSYELNARLESLQTVAETDGGNDPTVFEVGNNLELIHP